MNRGQPEDKGLANRLFVAGGFVVSKAWVEDAGIGEQTDHSTIDPLCAGPKGYSWLTP
jgi:hypothetical protein